MAGKTESKRALGLALRRPTIASIFYGWWIVLGAFISVAIGWGVSYFSILVFYPSLIDEFGWSRGQVATGGGLLFMLTGVFYPITGAFVDRYGVKRAMVLGILAIALSLFWLSSTSNLWQFYLNCGLVGIGLSTIGIMTEQILVSKWFKEKRGIAAGIITSGIGFGGIVCPIIASFLIVRFGWRNAFIGLDLLVWLIALPLTAIVIKEQPQGMGLEPYETKRAYNPSVLETKGKPYPESSLSLQQAFKSSGFWLLATGCFLHEFSAMGIIQHTVVYVRDLGFGLAQASSVLSVIAMFNIVGKLIFGPLSDRVDRKLAMFAAYLILALALTTVYLMPHIKGSLIAIYLCAAAIGLGWGGGIITLTLTSADFFGLKSLGRILGTIMLFFAVGGSAGPVITGYLFDYWGNYRNAFALQIFIAFVAAALIFLMRKPVTIHEVKKVVGR